ncbi:MAG: CBS and ACT domain-containing protein [Spirochaetaceae bacterium]
MVVKRVMTPNPFTVFTDTPLSEAQALIRREKVHRLPVLNKHKKLVGIVSEKDLLYASPSPATTLNVYEMGELLYKLKVESIMTKKVITITEDTLLEDAARILVDNDIGGLPVMRDDHLVGIITESDIFKLFIELFGTRQRGMRVTLRLPDELGEIARVTSAIADAGGNIISLGTFPGDDPTNMVCTVKVAGLGVEELREACSPLVDEIMDIREA